jgi:hypothetical protein
MRAGGVNRVEPPVIDAFTIREGSNLTYGCEFFNVSSTLTFVGAAGVVADNVPTSSRVTVE